MKSRTLIGALTASLIFLVGISLPRPAVSDDIDVFVGGTTGEGGGVRVLIVLDNTSNWARQSQQWPGGLQQGQSEVRAIKNALANLPADLNVGVMEFVTGGNANSDGGYVRHHIKDLSASNRAALIGKLDDIFNNINSPIEKRNSNTSYGNLLNDVHNYLKGGTSLFPSAVPSSKADPAGYTSTYTAYNSPLDDNGKNCGRTIMIFVGNADSNGPEDDSASNTGALNALGGDTSQLKVPDLLVQTQNVTRELGYTSQCYSSAASCSTADFATQCSTLSSCYCSETDKTTTYPSCTSGMHFKVVATANAGSTTTQNFPPQVQDSVDIGGGFVSACLSNANSLGAVACPAPNPQTTQSINGNQTTTTTVNWSNCGWSVHSTTGCTGNKKKFFKSATKTTTTSITTTNNTATQTTLGYTSGCFSSQATCSTAEFAATCASYSGGCACVSEDATATAATCPTGKARHQVLGNYTVTQALPVGTYSSSPNTANGDEWAKFLHQKGVKLSDGSKAYVTTYTIDVFNAQQSAEQTQLLRNMAAHGGGRYFAAQNEGAILDALNSIFAEVQAVNSTFASASLPVNSTNRAQNANEVYLGIFRPDPSAYPRWYGNTKRYQLKNVDGGIVLADSSGNPAVNPLTGFLSDCAKSFWTTDSGKFWFDIPSSPPAEGSCTSAGTDPFSDSPDGPFVEKGSVAEVLRKGNDPGGPETFKVNRKLLSDVGVANGGALGLLNTPPASDSNFELIRFLKGFDEADEDNDGIDEETRASIHGDVIHSRPLPINHGGSIGTVLYYGSNDMTYRAVRASDGKELWAFVPEEFSTKFDEMKRLRTNQPIVKYPNESASASSKPKSYFVDGSTGTYQSAFDTDLSDGFTPSNVWIYPTLRRGGRMVYALDVTSPDVPKKKWKFGCPNATDDFGCTDGASGIGQTWSLPSPAFISGFSPGTPALIFGGGYDSCEDANSSTPGCGSAKGKKVFILNADTGAVLRSFSTERSVAADPALVDYTGDGKADFAYMVDTGGAIYRVDFINPSTKAPLDSSLWSMKKIAFTKGSGRKFLFPPALLSVKGDKIYVAIGSGDREHPIRAYYPYTEPVVNRFYVYVDDLADSTSPATDMDKDVAMKDLSDDASCETEKVTPSGKLKGWYKDLNDHGKGEQVVTSAVIVAGLVTFSTNRPIPESEGSCSTPLGEARGYLLNLFNSSGAIGVAGSCGGAQSAIFPGGGLPPSPVLATVPIDGVTTTVLIGAPQKSGAQSSPIEAQKIDPTIKSKRSRVYWNLPIDPE